MPIAPDVVAPQYSYNWLVTNDLGLITEYLTPEAMIDFPDEGMYDIRLSTTDPWTGCGNTHNETVEAMLPPIADFALETDMCEMSIDINTSGLMAMASQP